MALFQFPDCRRDVDEEPVVTDFIAQIRKNKIVVSMLLSFMTFQLRYIYRYRYLYIVAFIVYVS